MLAPGNLQQTTDAKVVLPFYIYASVSFLVGTLLLLWHTDLVQQHYFYPYTLAITHIMALGWGTMIILGASHQLLPVLIEGKLDSNFLALLTFVTTAIGIPCLVVGFYQFNFGILMQIGAVLVNVGVLSYVINVMKSAFKSKKRNIHAWYMMAASLWLFSTTFFGLLLVCNFSENILPKNSVSYLSIHAHLGLVGWFLLLVIGVGSRLIPMFLISKYTNDRTLWQIFFLINCALISFIVIRLMGAASVYYYISVALALGGILLFANYCRKAYLVRIRKSVDEQMKTSLISVIQMVLPFLALILTLVLMPSDQYPNIALLYGFCIFFGWITAIILGMTFKTLPFIVWNKVYHKKAHVGKTPPPKDLFSEKVYQIMLKTYLLGFVIFILGIILKNEWILKVGAFALLITAILYVYNTSLTLLHQPKKQ
ncbi:cbb3-type cytochrome c oxidase subunit I [Elizabethkingia sp. JS20170427COW]|uniref:cbb3-type cytochrome c oxidase subunit I n=1 Tax=Elizabethkingia sp. JS20170427COW TaxID=2583851 RepID=UPI001110D42D|nr:cbb3-type cytochrome c oxidase subunit I [Elizabethkingia sp. JS20170427COW]QCX52303.1 cbb3-type cytochrome c oxidase subunit I [Elizabethkingia sp. JS20170427COW]